MTKPPKTRYIITERINPRTRHLDKCSTIEIIELISEEDKKVAEAVAKQKRNITVAADLIVSKLSRGGRLFFVGAGTSGRLGVMEAAECTPTFGTHPSLIQGVIAGGKKALWRSIESAEDSTHEAKKALSKLRLGEKDIVIGVAASATTPFVLGALSYTKKKGAARILITCNPSNFRLANINITLLVGP